MHAHIGSLCVHCSSLSNMQVYRTREEAVDYIQHLPEFFSSNPDFADIRLEHYADDVVRVHIGEHDLMTMIIFCDNEFNVCFENFKREAAMKMLANRMASILNEGLGDVLHDLLNSDEETPPPSETPRTKEDAYKHLLSQIDLPEDFFGASSA